MVLWRIDAGEAAASKRVTLRCPKCKTALSATRDRYGTAAEASMMAAFGVTQVRLRCPKCKVVMDATLAVGKEYE